MLLLQYLTDEEFEFDIAKQRVITERRISYQEKEKLRNIKYTSLIIEHSLYILWSHLDFYTMKIMNQSKLHCK